MSKVRLLEGWEGRKAGDEVEFTDSRRDSRRRAVLLSAGLAVEVVEGFCQWKSPAAEPGQAPVPVKSKSKKAVPKQASKKARR